MKSKRLISKLSKAMYAFGIIFLLTGMLLSAVSSPALAQEGQPAVQDEPDTRDRPQLNLSHILCTDDNQVEIHFVLLNIPDDHTPGLLTYTTDGGGGGTINPGKNTGNVWHYTDYQTPGYYNITSASVQVDDGNGGYVVTLHNPGDYAGNYCKEEEEGKPNLSIDVSADYGSCEGSTFSVTVYNDGDGDALEVIVNLSVIAGGAFVTSFSPTSKDIGTLAGGTSTTFEVAVVTDWTSAAPGAEIEVQAEVTASNTSGDSSSDSVKYAGDCGEEEPEDMPVKPVLECVDNNGDGTYTAHFGYLNQNEFVVEIPVGDAGDGRNTLTGNVTSGDLITTFQPGRVYDAFQIVFDGSNLVWTLRYMDTGNRTSTASSSSKLCQEPPEPLAVKPVLECVDDNGDGTYTAHFGYLNQNDFVVEIPVGDAGDGRNTLTGNVTSGDLITTFQPGRVYDAFQIVFDGSNLVWTLRYMDTGNRTSTASSSSKLCQEPEPEFEYSLQGQDSTTCLVEPGKVCVTFFVTLKNLPEGATALLETEGFGGDQAAVEEESPVQLELNAGESHEFTQDGIYEVTVCAQWPGIENPQDYIELPFSAWLSLKQGESTEGLDKAGAVVYFDPQDSECKFPEALLLILDPFCYGTNNGYKMAWQLENTSGVDTTFVWTLNGGSPKEGFAAANSVVWLENVDLGSQTVTVFWGDGQSDTLSGQISPTVCKAPTPTPPPPPNTPPVPVTAVEQPAPVVASGVLIPVTGVDLDANSGNLDFLKKLLSFLGVAFLGVGLIFQGVKKNLGE